jgi:hypothetical protein
MHPRFSRQKASIMVSNSWPVAFACLRPVLADSGRFLGSNDDSDRLPMSEAVVDVGQL